MVRGLYTHAQTDIHADGSGAKESECVSQEMLSLFRQWASSH